MTTPTPRAAEDWDAALQACLDRHLAAVRWPGPDGAALHAALTEAVTGGKRVRPRLLAEVHDALGGARADAVLDAAAAVELLHTAFVVHDDLIDGDDVRRGRPSVPGRFRGSAARTGAPDRAAGTYAAAGAVLAGDLALTATLRAVATLPAPPAVTSRVLDQVTRALAISAAGELADVRLALGGPWPEPEEVLELAEQKTAVYSFVLPMQVGALLADADEEVVALVGEAGRSLGIAFQLYDDLAGMFTDAGATGKDPLSDLREGKLTLLVSHAHASTAWHGIATHWGDPSVTPDGLAAVRAALEDCGSRQYVEQVAADHLSAGLAAAGRVGLGLHTIDWLSTLVDGRTEVAA